MDQSQINALYRHASHLVGVRDKLTLLGGDIKWDYKRGLAEDDKKEAVLVITTALVHVKKAATAIETLAKRCGPPTQPRPYKKTRPTVQPRKVYNPYKGVYQWHD